MLLLLLDHGLVLPEQVAGRDEQHMLSTAVSSSVCCLQCQNAAEGHLLLSALQESRILTAWCKWAHLLPGPGPAQMEVGAEALGFGCSSSSSAAAVAVAKVSSQQRQPALMHSTHEQSKCLVYCQPAWKILQQQCQVTCCSLVLLKLPLPCSSHKHICLHLFHRNGNI